MRNKRNILLRFIVLIFGVLITSFYLFPIGLKGLPSSLNSKQILAVVGVMIFAYKSIQKQSLIIHKEIFVSFWIACLFSLVCLYSVVSNSTSDMSYATYVVSFIVWLAGAYGACQLLKILHGQLDLSVLTKFMAITCVLQCIAALMVENLGGFKNFVDTWIVQDKTPLKLGRLYGLGMSLDSGGVRLCMTLILIAYQLAHSHDNGNSRLSYWTYIIVFCALSVLGNMIARTTTVGVLLGGMYIILSKTVQSLTDITAPKLLRFYLFVIIIVAVISYITYLYDNNPIVNRKIRFAFEAFFNLFETGKLRTDSSDVLMSRMWVWPKDTKGWIIGYGLFEELYKEYAQTDIGYCRFTMYCGLTGMSIFSLFFLFNATVVSRKIPEGKLLSLILVAFTFILWIKVSTDIFQLYALLFCVAFEPHSNTKPVIN